MQGLGEQATIGRLGMEVCVGKWHEEQWVWLVWAEPAAVKNVKSESFFMLTKPAR